MSRRVKRPTSDYIEAAKRLAQFAPVLAKYKRRKNLKPYEKSVIKRYENALRFVDNLVPITKKQYRDLKDEVYIPYTKNNKPIYGIHALRLKGMSPNTKIMKVKNTDITIASNGRKWLFWKLDKLNDKTWRRTLSKAANTAFNNPADAFPIEKIANLAELAFKQITQPKAIYLWTRHGPVGQPFRDLSSFMDWLTDTYARSYKDTDEWMNGIAILAHGAIQAGHKV
jgi:hypothetical protein